MTTRDLTVFQNGHFGLVGAYLDKHDEHLVVFSVVQNLDGIDAVVLIICTLRVRPVKDYSRPENWGYWVM